VAQGFRACGRDQRALRSPFGNLRTASKFVELYRSFSERNTRKSYGEVTSSIARKGGKGQRPLVSPNKHAEEVRRSHLLNREKGSPEGRRPFGGVKGQRPLRLPLINVEGKETDEKEALELLKKEETTEQ
jgi:hypothetical protein